MMAIFGKSDLRARLLAALLGVVIAGAAQAAEPAGTTGDGASQLEAQRTESSFEYDRLSKEAALSDERIAALTADIDAVRKDYASITAALIQAAKTEKKLAEDVEDSGDRLQVLKGRQAELRGSLRARRGVLAEVLGALERMGLNPPPALLVKPEDALSSVRSAILLGAVVPGLRAETEVLIADLNELTRLAASIEGERDRLKQTIAEQMAERTRLKLLLGEKKKVQAKTQAELEAERQKSADLASKAKSLQGLIASLEKQIDTVRSAEEQARLAEEARKQREETLAAMPVPEKNRLVGPVPFSSLKSQLALPAAGRFARRFGSSDGAGGVMQGDILATQSDAIVTAPADGSVLYAGPFRSYGQLLILNAGDGYHVVLAGMDRISVSSGQSVLAGEPVGAMGEARVASAVALEKGNTGPELYVEFRKDGKPVDPGPWWSERLSGRTGNDS
jgi:septal ring factor EnvC (AmiA/AmiB activator)